MKKSATENPSACPDELERVEETQGFHQRKLESLGVLAGSVAHDLNNLLAGILGHVSFLRIVLGEEGAHQDSVAAIENGVRRAASLTQQILDFVRKEDVVLSTVPLAELTRSALTLLRTTLPEGIELKEDYSAEELFVHGDEGQLIQLVSNLTCNARDALTQQGTVTVSLEPTHIAQKTSLGEFVLEPGVYARLVVSDTGMGIPEAILDRIFEPFFTTKDRQGTGIGLATVLAIVKAHRGAVWVESEETKGARFEVLLPLGTAPGDLDQPPQKLEKAPAQKSSLPLGTERILVVDDEEAVRTVMQRSLELLGYEVEIASNGKEALECVRGRGEDFSLVIIDMIMPHMPGDELFYALRSLNGTIKVLIASGYSSDARTRAILKDGAAGFIQKPFAVEDLAQAVRACLDQG